ncbi:hypothetical protein MCEMSEM23_03042 [Rhabdaerophilaceae bacterium]
MSKLHFWEYPWPLDEQQCPCDVHFMRFLAGSGRQNQRIFHFGTGEHHLVGQEAGAQGHAVLGITASEAEYQAYMRLVVETPALGPNYKVIFGDIYQLNLRLLPQFDIVTLFHSGEFWSENNAQFATIDDAGLINGMIDHLAAGGLILFYTGSFAYDVPKRLLTEIVVARGLVEQPGFETLRIFSKP